MSIRRFLSGPGLAHAQRADIIIETVADRHNAPQTKSPLELWCGRVYNSGFMIVPQLDSGKDTDRTGHALLNAIEEIIDTALSNAYGDDGTYSVDNASLVLEEIWAKLTTG